MQYRHLFPMVRILLPLLAGIIVCNVVNATSEISLIVVTILLLAALASGYIAFKNLRFISRWLYGIIISCFLFVGGFNLVLHHKEILHEDHFSKFRKTGIYITRVEEPLQVKEHSFKTILRVTAIIQGDSIINVNGRLLAYFAKDSIINPPEEGALIAFSGAVQPIGPPQNPGSFDYRKYMASNNVYNQVYIKSASWKLLEKPQGLSILRTAHRVSGYFVSVLSNNGLKGREFAVASALIMGQSDMLDNETLQAYSGTGVMHILSVSGLHVGVIFIIISFLLGFMKNKGAQLYFKTVIILITIWVYALLTGMSPSVLRSAVMFTFISIGNASNRNVHIINSLAVSALVLLLYDPLMINNIGFQLSYIAILGIVFINKPIADLCSPKTRVARYIWEMIAVSIAAQIATAPLAMYYFHQFPAYFIPANLVAIPLSFLAIYSGVAVLATSFIPIIGNFFGTLTNYILYALNYAVSKIEQLPYSVLHISSIFTMETILIYLIIISAILFIYFKRKELIYLTLSGCLILSVCFANTEIGRQNQQKILFYATGKQTAIGFIKGKQQILIADNVLLKDKIASKFQLDGTRSLYGISSGFSYSFDTTAHFTKHLMTGSNELRNIGNCFIFNKKRIALVDSLPKLAGNISKLSVDYLLIRNNPHFKAKNLLQFYSPKMILIDGTNSFNKTEKWLKEFREMGIKVYSLQNSGAYMVDL